MENIKKMLSLLDQKELYFTEYENITNEMLSCPAEDLELKIDLRQKLIPKIDEVDAQLSALADLLEDSTLVKDALRLKCSRSDLPGEIFPLFDKAQMVCAIVNRIRRCEPSIVDRFENELDILTQQIKENNRSVSAQASKYRIFADGQSGQRILDKA